MTVFSQRDIEQIMRHGLSVADAEKQMADFARGFPYANIVAPASVGDGIVQLDDAARRAAADTYDAYRQNHKIVKFVPASGAATRMFKDLFEFLSSGDRNPVVEKVLQNIDKFAFYDDLKKFISASTMAHDIIAAIIGVDGLNYGNCPKGLIKFHGAGGGARTAAAEHLGEGAEYAVSSDNSVRIHFTVSPEHRTAFESLFAKLVDEYSARYGVAYDITMSEQMAKTDTIAAAPDNTPFRTDDGSLLFRPAGHGALIENLNNIDADIIFVKNIDNVCAEHVRSDTIEYKRALAGVLVQVQAKIFDYISRLDDADDAVRNEIREFISNTLCVRGASDFDTAQIRKILNRPTRVCGVVRNTGAPGGGPFMVRGADGLISPQIVESSQIAPDARDIMDAASHFNPVDLVCAVRNINGDKFDLTKFIDENTGFISDKSKNGRPLRAMEKPGLWNGAMANWNTIFVEVPPTTFSPVKVVSDLLTLPHQQA